AAQPSRPRADAPALQPSTKAVEELAPAPAASVRLDKPAPPPRFAQPDPEQHRALPESPRSARAAAPEIHVKTGRIEVRALVPPPAAPRVPAPSPAPQVSLNDYLKQLRGRT